MESATTNLSEVNADVLRLFNVSSRQHEDIRDIFVHGSSVVQPVVVETPVGDEIDTSLVYENPTNDQVPALQGLLDYLGEQYPAGDINKYYNIHKKFTHRVDGDVHVTHIKRHVSKRDVRFSLDVYAPMVYNKRVYTTKIFRPIYIFTNSC